MKMIKGTDTSLLAALPPRSVVLHQVNCAGIAETGVAAAVRAKFPKWYDDYRVYCSWFKAGAFQSDHTDEIIGTFHRFCAGDNLIICSAFAQRAVAGEADYGAWAKILRRIERQTRSVNMKPGPDWTIHAPSSLFPSEGPMRELLDFYFSSSPVDIYLHAGS